MPYSHETFVYVNHLVKYVVEFYIIPEDPGVWTYPNGDPGYPAEPASCEIVSVKYSDSGEIVEDHIFDFLQDDIEKECWNVYKSILNDVP